MNRMGIIVWTITLILAGCGGENTAMLPDAAPAQPPSDGSRDQSGSHSLGACSYDLWSELSSTYPEATAVGSCADFADAGSIVETLMNMTDIRIDDGTGSLVEPCLETRCDDSYVYVASNAIPHYDFIQTTPNALTATTYLYRVPRQVNAIDAASVTTEAATSIRGCATAYDSFLNDTATTREPSGWCIAQNTDTPYFTENGRTYRKISCLGTVAFLNNGSPTYGPNEGPMPDPWGNPGFFYPDTAAEDYVDETNLRAGAALDLCGGHTANSMHYHAANERCFQLDSTGAPANSYVSATQTWTFQGALEAECSEESGVVGWSPDGHPIKGPCICVERSPDGACVQLRRARSAWVYRGIGAWGSSEIAMEGEACTSDADCGANQGCSWSVFEDASAPGATAAARRCVVMDYAWCTHHFVDRATTDTSTTNFVYLDRCNGYEGPDGYAYHTTYSFPYLQACYRDEIAELPRAGGGGGMMGGGMMPGGGGMMPGGGMDRLPTCEELGRTMMCCGDGMCRGPETATNCPEDCA